MTTVLGSRAIPDVPPGENRLRNEAYLERFGVAPMLHQECSIMHSMDDSTAALASAIGVRVKQERQSRRWTLDRLAEAAGVSRRMVVNVEQGAANPSVGTLLRISDALGVGLPALVEPPAATPVRVTRRVTGATLWSGDSGGRGVLVAGTEPPDVVELWDWTLGPGDRHVSEPHAHGTEELVKVHEGAIVVEVAERVGHARRRRRGRVPRRCRAFLRQPAHAAGQVLVGRLRARCGLGTDRRPPMADVRPARAVPRRRPCRRRGVLAAPRLPRAAARRRRARPGPERRGE